MGVQEGFLEEMTSGLQFERLIGVGQICAKRCKISENTNFGGTALKELKLWSPDCREVVVPSSGAVTIYHLSGSSH